MTIEVDDKVSLEVFGGSVVGCDFKKIVHRCLFPNL
jgi:hypothetical protein